MVETVWVLERAYDLTPLEIFGAIERVLQTDVLVVENEQEVFTAMIALKEGQGSFADVIIATLGAKRGCSRSLCSPHKLAVLKARQPGVACGLAFMFLEVMAQLLAYTLIEQNPHSSLCRQELLRFFKRGDSHFSRNGRISF